MEYVQKSVLRGVYRKRGKWVHKGQFGKLLVVAGSESHTGSPIFVGMSAARAGCDLVYLVGPRRSMDVAANYSPSLITNPLEGKRLEPRHVKTILDMVEVERVTALAIGPGLWRIQKTRQAINMLVRKVDLPMVLDADAIRAVSSIKDGLRGKKIVLTPHANEFLELAGINVSGNINERVDAVRKVAYGINCGKSNACPLNPPITILLKGHVDVISNGKDILLNKTGNVLMTKGGCGDTLTGICAAMLARSVDTFRAAAASAYINGKAGEWAAKKFGESLLPTDLIEEIPNVIKGV
ncbi:MAG: NAD(P)H-hydrate dehydratase [Candidatus Aenigmarchaeota archaeon]|nr:NAD(P)H-hydrate dehydratase [Candidatus Aenigmarchaeota archaeon]